MIGGVISANPVALLNLPSRAKGRNTLRLRLALRALGAPIAFFLFCQAVFSQSNGLVEGQGSNASRTLLGNSERLNLSQGGAGRDSYSDAARLYRRGQYIEAANAYKIACARSSAKACTDLGVMYRRGQGVRKNYPRAAEFSLRGCDGGNALGCINLGLMYWNNVLPKNDERAAELFERGCDSGDTNGCRALGFLYENGQGVPKDLNRAAFFYQKAREHRIPFKIQDGLILIETQMNDAMVKLIVDTGGITSLGMRFLPPTQPLDSPTRAFNSVHGSLQVYPISVTWVFDGKDRRVTAFAGDFDFPNGLDGIFGADILKTFQSARFDFLNSVLVLEDR